MSNEDNQRVRRVTALIASAALVFYLFFQINKNGPLGEINPFGADPYDAVGSFAFQGAVLVGILTYARALRLHEDPSQAAKTRLIMRGNLLVLLAILVTLLADALAEILQPFALSFWGYVLLGELAGMFLLAIICFAAWAVTFGRVKTVSPPRNLTPADGIDDLWTLIRVPATKTSNLLPHSLVAWVERFNSDRLFLRISALNPRIHPWRFASCLGLLVGIGLALAQLQEGLPPSLLIGLVIAVIFICGEFVAILAGFALLRVSGIKTRDQCQPDSINGEGKSHRIFLVILA